jgi:hypothetical protein
MGDTHAEGAEVEELRDVEFWLAPTGLSENVQPDHAPPF